MKPTIAFLPVLALLSACGSTDGELNAGSWKTTMTMTKFDIPGAPAAMAAQAKASLGKGQSSEACMSPAQAKAGIGEFSSSMQQGDCKMQDFKKGDGKMSGTMICTDSATGATSMTMNGTYAADKVSMTLAGDIKEEKLPGGKAAIEMTISSERVGDCKS